MTNAIEALPNVASTKTRGVILATALVSLVAACAPNEEVLPGQRYDLRDLSAAEAVLETAQDVDGLPPAPQPPREIPQPDYSIEGEAQRISLPRAQSVASWPQTAQNTAHLIPHAQLRDGALSQLWSVPIGEGSGLRLRLSASPVVADGRIFVLDSEMKVTALGTNGTVLWQRDLVPTGETAGEVTGGGLAVSGGTLFVTTGFGRLYALSVTNGAEAWRQKFAAATPSAPMVDSGLVYLVSRDGFGSAVDAETGRILWQVEGTPVAASVIGSDVPSLAGRAVIFPFGDGELTAVLRQAGVSLWSSSVAGSRVGRAYGGVGGITGGPVVSGDTIYVATEAGRLAALDVASGARLWTSLEGATGTVITAGGSLFLISDEAKMLRINASDGETIWSATLPLFEESKVKRRKAVYVHYGPVLAGGRLIVASTDGLLREVDPASGVLLRTTDLGAPAAATPIVVGGTLYVLTQDGMLRAFR